MNKLELNKYIETLEPTMTIGDLDKAYSITLHNLSLSVVIAIANKISSEVVTDLGEYRPELKEPLLLFYILKESADIEFDSFDAEEMFALLNSNLGQKVIGQSKYNNWLNKLDVLVKEKIVHRNSIYCNPNSLVNDKLITLIDKELSVQNAMYDSVKYMEDLSQNFTADDMSNFMVKISEFTEMMKNPKLNDRFIATVQKNAQEDRLVVADGIIKMNAARNVLADK